MVVWFLQTDNNTTPTKLFWVVGWVVANTCLPKLHRWLHQSQKDFLQSLPLFLILWFDIWGRSDQWLLRYSTLNIFIGGHLHFKRFDFGLFLWALIFRGRLSLKDIFITFDLISVWTSELKFKIWGRSDQCLLRYSTFDYLGSSSIGGCLHFKHFWFWFVPLILNLKFEEDLISVCWDIQLLIFWGHLTLKAICIASIVDPLSLSSRMCTLLDPVGTKLSNTVQCTHCASPSSVQWGGLCQVQVSLTF